MIGAACGLGDDAHAEQAGEHGFHLRAQRAAFEAQRDFIRADRAGGGSEGGHDFGGLRDLIGGEGPAAGLDAFGAEIAAVAIVLLSHEFILQIRLA